MTDNSDVKVTDLIYVLAIKLEDKWHKDFSDICDGIEELHFNATEGYGGLTLYISFYRYAIAEKEGVIRVDLNIKDGSGETIKRIIIKADDSDFALTQGLQDLLRNIIHMTQVNEYRRKEEVDRTQKEAEVKEMEENVKFLQEMIDSRGGF